MKTYFMSRKQTENFLSIQFNSKCVYLISRAHELVAIIPGDVVKSSKSAAAAAECQPGDISLPAICGVPVWAQVPNSQQSKRTWPG